MVKCYTNREVTAAPNRSQESTSKGNKSSYADALQLPKTKNVEPVRVSVHDGRIGKKPPKKQKS